MQRTLTTAMAATFVIALTTTAHAQSNQLQGFVGLTFGDVASSSTFGGSLAVPLTDNVQIIGEGGRYKKILVDSSLQSFLTGGDFSVNQVRIGAGVRF
jgi:hypothetical protein